jgi:hypothetical protein
MRRRRIDHRPGLFRAQPDYENGRKLAESALFSHGLTCADLDVQLLAAERNARTRSLRQAWHRNEPNTAFLPRSSP